TLHVEGIEDLSGNVLASAADRSFSTGTGADLVPTGVVQYSPANATNNVGLNTKVVVSFNERLNPLTVNSDSVALYDTTNGQRLAGSTALSADGKTVTLTPTAALAVNRQYYVYVSYWAYLYDQAGNRMNYTYWTFTTGAS
ncbi:Ig-like domain-containing protein, partial [Methylobacter sp.]|uniref:Ig-like domain-containing protein n=1 Tax=Methylobacter sp. TaxID=2051955 RepID=UPI0011FEDDFF